MTLLPCPDELDEKPLAHDELLRGLLSGLARVRHRLKKPIPADLRQALRRLGTSAEREIDELYSYQRGRTRRWLEENS